MMCLYYCVLPVSVEMYALTRPGSSEIYPVPLPINPQSSCSGIIVVYGFLEDGGCGPMVVTWFSIILWP